MSCELLAVGCWLLPVGCWLLIVCCLLFVVCCLLFAHTLFCVYLIKLVKLLKPSPFYFVRERVIVFSFYWKLKRLSQLFLVFSFSFLVVFFFEL